jgi:uncharacterized membrane protein
MPGIHNMREELKSEMMPLASERRDLMNRMVELLTADKLDTLSIRQIGDSLNQVRSAMENRIISHLSQVHDQLSPDARRELCNRMLRRIEDGKGLGRGGHPPERDDH